MLRFVTKYTPNVLSIHDPLTNQGMRVVNHAMALSHVGACNAGWVQYENIHKDRKLDYDVLFVQQSALLPLQELITNTTKIVIVDLDGAALPSALIPHIHGYTAEHVRQLVYASALRKPLTILDTFLDVPSWPVTVNQHRSRFGIPPGAIHAEEYQEVSELIQEIARAIPDIPFFLPVEVSAFLPKSIEAEYYDPPTSTYERWDIYRQITIGLLPGSSTTQKTMLPILECGASRIPMIASQLYSQLLSSPTLGSIAHTSEKWIYEAQRLSQQEGLRTQRGSSFYEKIVARRSLLRGSFYVKEAFSTLYKQIIGSFLKTEAA